MECCEILPLFPLPPLLQLPAYSPHREPAFPVSCVPGKSFFDIEKDIKTDALKKTVPSSCFLFKSKGQLNGLPFFFFLTLRALRSKEALKL